ncbi:MAG: roadblock/LC7 domain-containing protein [Proteobacteria bacterium]|nr:roadblock/LC7 domain-containing protein [Pseudomonadota bacterium]NIS69454.1 roadblock/LC7 domain-containing protein [Pseudomonadota bacterium]
MEIILSQEDIQGIDACLKKMLNKSAALSAYLIDRSGQLITNCGSPSTLDVSAFSALTAANFGATSEIAKLLGEEEFNLLFHKGQNENVYFAVVGENMIIVIVFDDRTTVGLVRLSINMIMDELLKIISPIYEKRE